MIFIIPLFILEVIIATLFIYFLIKADKWVLKKLAYVNSIESDITYEIRVLREKLKSINAKLTKSKSNEPLTAHEFGFIFGKLFSEIIKSSTGFGKHAILYQVFKNIWTYKTKLKPTVSLIVQKVIG